MSALPGHRPGRRPRRRHRRPALPAAAARRRAGARRHRHRLRRHRLAASSSRPVPGGGARARLVASTCWSARRSAAEPGAPVGRASLARRRRGWCWARCCSPASLADGGQASLARARRRARCCAALGWLARRRRCSSARARRLEPRRRRRCSTAYADGAALLLAAIAIFVPPLAFLALAGFVVLLVARPQARGREVRRACASCGDRGSRRSSSSRSSTRSSRTCSTARSSEGRAPALAGAPRPRHLRPRLRVDLPVGHAGGLGRDRHRAAARASTTSRR